MLTIQSFFLLYFFLFTFVGRAADASAPFTRHSVFFTASSLSEISALSAALTLQ